MVESQIELRKIRDFGANISDTFEFIRQNFKPMIKCFFAIAGIFILLQAVSSGIFESRVFFNVGEIGHRGSGGFGQFQKTIFLKYLSYPFLLYMVFAWLAYVAMQVCVGGYMKYYDANDKKQPGIEEVWDIFKTYYLKVLIYTIPVTILIIIGCLFCLLPGIFLAVVFVPFPWILMMEDASLGDGIQRCFDLIKGNFWMSLGIYLVTYVIYSFASGIIGLLIGIISGLLAYITTKDMSSTIGIATSVLRIFSFLFYIIFLVSAMLNYFNLAEQRDAIGMLRRIDQVGNNRNDDNDMAEQY